MERLPGDGALMCVCVSMWAWVNVCMCDCVCVCALLIMRVIGPGTTARTRCEYVCVFIFGCG